MEALTKTGRRRLPRTNVETSVQAALAQLDTDPDLPAEAYQKTPCGLSSAMFFMPRQNSLDNEERGRPQASPLQATDLMPNEERV